MIGSSPERFLALDRDGDARGEADQGHRARACADPADDRAAAHALRTGAKDRAENLMIVDVLRNDLGRVAEVGSVAGAVADGGRELRDRPPARLDRARAPAARRDDRRLPASRVPRRLDDGRAEAAHDGAHRPPRGAAARRLRRARSATSAADGSADLSIAIRTIVNSPLGMTIGAGGAITVQSDPQAELARADASRRAPRSTPSAWRSTAAPTRRRSDAPDPAERPRARGAPRVRGGETPPVAAAPQPRIVVP